MSSASDFVIKNGVVIRYSGHDANVIIPYGVTSIGKYAFSECSSLSSVTIPDSVTSIEAYAFFQCSSLKSVTISDSVTSIDDSAFSKCCGLADKSGMIIFRRILYGYCGDDKNVVIPDGVTSIGAYAFSGCSSLSSVTIPDSVTSIGAYAFSGCSSLSSVTIPDSVTSIEEGAFNNCDGLADKSGMIIFRRILYGYCGDDKNVVIPDGVTTIGAYAFYGRRSLSSVTIPDSVTTIGAYAFDWCSSLKSITIPDSVKSIEKGAFHWCSGLDSVTIPDGVTSIGENAFCGCSSMSSVTIPDGVTSIGDEAFSGCHELTSIGIPETVTTIGREAFHGCDGFTSVIIPDAVIKLEWNAFQYCEKLQTISLPERLAEILDYHKVSNVNLGVVLRGSEKSTFLAYVAKTHSDTRILLRDGGWNEYDLELINDGPKFKYKIATRLLGMLGRLEEGREMTEEKRQMFIELLKKNAKKLVPIAEALKCPDIIRTAFAQGVITSQNQKAIQKMLAGSHVTQIAALSQMQIESQTQEELCQKVQSKSAEPESALEREYSQKWKEIKGDKIFRDMKMSGVGIPEVKLKDGKKAPEVLFRYILASYGALFKTDCQIIPEADEAANLLSYDSLCSAMEVISDNINGLLYPSLLPVLCRFANARQIKQLVDSWNEWGNWGRYGAKGRYVQDILNRAMLLSERREAVVWLEKKNCLKNYARIRGMKLNEVYVKYLFDFGFDEQGLRRFDIGTTVIEARLTEDLSLELINTINGKVVKQIPKKNVDPDVQKRVANELDDMRRNLKKALKIVRDLLYSTFLDNGSIPAENWCSSYLHNPFLRSIAKLLVWEQDGHRFIVSGQNLVDVHENPYVISKNPIFIAHPMEMRAEDVEAWQKYLTHHGLKQPFDQMWEPCYNPKEICPDRYCNCEIPPQYLKNQERRGISISWYSSQYEESTYLTIKGFSVEVPNTYQDKVKILSLVPKKWNRQANMIIAFLDRITIYDRIRQDDSSVMKQISRFTLAQIMEFIKIATENNCTNVTALLLDYKNRVFADYSPMEEFSLDL